MATFSNTPAPWVREPGTDCIIAQRPGYTMTIASIYGPDGEPAAHESETIDNARLIMAAPALLAALQKIANCNIADLADYCAAVDSIAIDALTELDCSDWGQGQ